MMATTPIVAGMVAAAGLPNPADLKLRRFFLAAAGLRHRSCGPWKT
jgi:hypothetical protein